MEKHKWSLKVDEYVIQLHYFAIVTIRHEYWKLNVEDGTSFRMSVSSYVIRKEISDLKNKTYSITKWVHFNHKMVSVTILSIPGFTFSSSTTIFWTSLIVSKVVMINNFQFKILALSMKIANKIIFDGINLDGIKIPN